MGAAPLGGALASCAPPPLPDPREAAQRFVESVKAGDAMAVRESLTTSSRQRYPRQRVEELIRENRRELDHQAQWVVDPATRVQMSAVVSFDDDRTARLLHEDGGFRVVAASALPAAARTPTEALGELRAVLSRRSYEGLLRVLTRDARQALDGSLRALVEALEDPSTVAVEVEGRRATARLPGGHSVKMEREDGVWRVKDFD